jgi:hypothetical protein
MQVFKSVIIVMAIAATYALKAQDIHSLSLGQVAVNGNPDEWPQPFRYYEGTTKLQFAFANDTQLRLFNSGLNICVDPKGKKKESVTLSFPLKPEMDAGEGGGQKHHHQGQGEGGPDAGMQKTDLLRLKHHARTQQLTLRIKGFTGLPEQVLPLENAYHITAAFDWDSLDILTIEYRLPLALILGHSLAATDTLKPIGVGFIEPAPEAVHTNNSGGVPEGDLGAGDVSQSHNNGMYNNGMGGMNNGMGGNGMGRGMGGGGNRGGGHFQDTNPANQEQKVWSKVFLKWITNN